MEIMFPSNSVSNHIGPDIKRPNSPVEELSERFRTTSLDSSVDSLTPDTRRRACRRISFCQDHTVRSIDSDGTTYTDRSVPSSTYRELSKLNKLSESLHKIRDRIEECGVKFENIQDKINESYKNLLCIPDHQSDEYKSMFVDIRSLEQEKKSISVEREKFKTEKADLEDDIRILQLTLENTGTKILDSESDNNGSSQAVDNPYADSEQSRWISSPSSIGSVRDAEYVNSNPKRPKRRPDSL